ncbi:tetratricopeptide repeat protein, partial [Streptomyces sp. DT193]|uniref:tetratricopeptide repeat protein n=1 Tax=Streptomyces sp. DT193 TaxID=3393418 RepID=UPI003CF27DFB
MQDGRNGGDNPALTELRRRLNDGLASSWMDKKDLPGRSGLGRTTVWEALQDGEPMPSGRTVGALARALGLPVEELLALQRDAAGGGGGTRSAPGRPIGGWEPHALEVHPAGPGNVVLGKRGLPGYVERAHDRVLSEAVRHAAAGRSRMVVLVGSSSTGKTRACWEAVQPLADEGWRLWHPFDPTRAAAALDDLHRVAPRTVVWLNEAQHYLGDREAGERIAAALHGLLTTAEYGPVLVLGTLWPEYAARYAALPSPGGPDPHSRARELLSGRTLTVPATFDAQALATTAALARGGDRLLADALSRAGASGRVAQDLAGAPELLKRYEQATPAAKAVLESAMDARRLGVGLHLSQAFLTDAAADYLTDTDYDQLTKDWAEQAYAELAQPVHGKQSPLRSTTPRPRRQPPTPTPPIETPPPSPVTAGPMFRLADYLEQHGRTARRPLCPPASFWHAALTHLTNADDLNNLTEAAENRHRLQWAHHLRHRAANHGSPHALWYLAVTREDTGDREGAETLYRQAADHGNTAAMYRLAGMREETGDREGAEALARQAADHGTTDVLYRLAGMREETGDREGAEALARQALDYGNTDALCRLALMREETGDREGAEAPARQAADHGNTDALYRLALMRERAGDREGAEALARQAADHGTTDVLNRLGGMREETGDRKDAETLYRQAADHGNTDSLVDLALMREQVGDREGAEALARQAVDHGSPHALYRLALMREQVGDQESAEALARQAADHGNTDVLYRLALMREEAGDQDGAETLYRQAADHGNTHALNRLALMREEAGDQESAEALARQAADHGNTDV